MSTVVAFAPSDVSEIGVDPEKETYYSNMLQSCVETELLRYDPRDYSTFESLCEEKKEAFVRHLDGRPLRDTALHYFTIFAEDVTRVELLRLVRSIWHGQQLRIYVTRRDDKLEAWWRAAS